MYLLKRILLIVFLLLLIFIGHTLTSTGYFRTVENTDDFTIVKQIELPGAEDITIAHKDSFALISSTDRAARWSNEELTGGLFYLDLKNENYELLPLTGDWKLPFAPHGISMLSRDSTYQVMAINHTDAGHSIEVFSLEGKKLIHHKTLRDLSMISPNDLIAVDEERFYFTNDHGYTEGFMKRLEDYGGMSFSNVVYYDGSSYREVASGIAYANGINYDAQRRLLYVASPRGFLVKVYSVKEDGSLNFVEDISCGTGVDNIELDPAGNLWIGSHPSLLRFDVYSKGKKETAPSEIIKINYRGTGDYTIEQVYEEDGTKMSASSVATPFGNRILFGNVMDQHFQILQLPLN